MTSASSHRGLWFIILEINPARFTLSLVDKVIIGTCNLASAILNFTESPSLDITVLNSI